MLQFLVTSKTRRRLLVLLWGSRKQQGSVAELAELANVSFAGAHGELKSMLRLGLVVATKTSSKEVFAANVAHPAADLWSKLAEMDVTPRIATTEEDDSLKKRLVSLGAPLRGVKPTQLSDSDVLPTLVDSLQLARRDAVVARTLPLCFWNARNQLEGRALRELDLGPEEKHAFAFFLELTGELGGDRRLHGLAEGFLDLRLTQHRPFFHTMAVGSERSFDLAKKWGFSMNMDFESFRTLFDKYVTR